MSSLLNYYDDQGTVSSSNDIKCRSSLTESQCDNFYLAPAPMGWYNDVSQPSIGQRPVRQRYQVGLSTVPKGKHIPQSGNFGCKQPCWNNRCK